MKAIFDTSSLMALVKYYLPFDLHGRLLSCMVTAFNRGEIVIIDKVVTEAKYLSKGIIIEKLDFISNNKRLIMSTADILPDRKFLNRLDNEFCNKDTVRLAGLTSAEYESQKSGYLETADAKIILTSMMLRKTGGLIQEKVLVVTEESLANNDGKVFKKIPAICGLVDLDCCDLPKYIKDHAGIQLGSFGNSIADQIVN